MTQQSSPSPSLAYSFLSILDRVLGTLPASRRQLRWAMLAREAGALESRSSGTIHRHVVPD